jgi:PAS domain S-box-containing protein
VIQKDDKSFIALFQAHPMPMWVYDLETLVFRAVNAAAIAHYGYAEAEFLGMTLKDIRPSDDLPKLDRNLAQAPLAAIEKSGVWRHRKKDGSLIDVEITSHPISFNNRACKFVLAHDVTERLAAQSRITRLNRTYAVLSGINSAIVRTRDRQTLVDETCRIATIEGEFTAACIGVVDPDSLDGKIVAQAGLALSLIGSRPITARTDAADADWPPNRALRERQPVICNDLWQAPWFAPRIDQSAGDNPRAMAAFPLTANGDPVGVLMLFADAIGYFDEAECRLLDELAADVSFSLQYIEREGERKRVADRLRESEAGLRRAQVMNKIGHVITGPDGAFESWSDTLPSLIGVTPDAMPPTTRKWLDIIHADDRNCSRRLNFDPPCRLNSDPGPGAAC